MNIADYLPWLHFVVLPIVMLIYASARKILDEVRTLNGRMIKMETWSTGHDKSHLAADIVHAAEVALRNRERERTD